MLKGRLAARGESAVGEGSPSALRESAARPAAPPTQARVEANPGLAFEAIEKILLAAIRGMSFHDLVAELGEEEGEVAAAVQRYLSEGRLVLRGSKLYLP